MEEVQPFLGPRGLPWTLSLVVLPSACYGSVFSEESASIVWDQVGRRRVLVSLERKTLILLAAASRFSLTLSRIWAPVLVP